MANWKYTIKGFDEIFDANPDDNEAKARLIVRKLDRFQNTNGPDSELEKVIEDFNIYTNEDGEYFEKIMEGLYDWADWARVRIQPRRRPPLNARG